VSKEFAWIVLEVFSHVVDFPVIDVAQLHRFCILLLLVFLDTRRIFRYLFIFPSLTFFLSFFMHILFEYGCLPLFDKISSRSLQAQAVNHCMSSLTLILTMTTINTLAHVLYILSDQDLSQVNED